MRSLRQRVPLVVLGLVARVAARCGKPASTSQPPKKLARCELDHSAHYGTGSGVWAKVAGPGDVLTGEAATGRAGDVLLKNDRIQPIIEQADRVIGPSRMAATSSTRTRCARGRATTASASWGSLFRFGRTVATEEVEFLRDGSKGGPAAVAATGRDRPLDFIHLQGLLGEYAGREHPERRPRPEAAGHQGLRAQPRLERGAGGGRVLQRRDRRAGVRGGRARRLGRAGSRRRETGTRRRSPVCFRPTRASRSLRGSARTSPTRWCRRPTRTRRSPSRG